MAYPMVRSSIVADYPELARERGLDPEALLHAVGLPLRCQTEQDLLIRVGKVHRLLELSSAKSGTPDFGLQLSRTRRLSKLGVLGVLMRDERTVREALRRFVTSSHLNGTAHWVQLSEHDGLALIRLFLDADGQPSIRQGTEMAVGGLVRVLQQLIVAKWRPREVFFMHEPAQGRDVTAQFFGCPVRFSAEFDGFTMQSEDLDQAIPLAEGSFARYASLASSEALVRREALTVHRTRQRILALMVDGRCSSQEVARTFGVDRRTLHRHLAAEKTSFMRIYDEIRLELAQRYLRAGNIGASDIAGLLGMDSLSSFSRWFKRQTGRAPSQWLASVRE